MTRRLLCYPRHQDTQTDRSDRDLIKSYDLNCVIANMSPFLLVTLFMIAVSYVLIFSIVDILTAHHGFALIGPEEVFFLPSKQVFFMHINE